MTAGAVPGELFPDLPEWALPVGYVWADDRVSACRSCHAEVRWSITRAGSRAPLNRDGHSHFSTCPQARDWRKRA